MQDNSQQVEDNFSCSKVKVTSDICFQEKPRNDYKTSYIAGLAFVPTRTIRIDERIFSIAVDPSHHLLYSRHEHAGKNLGKTSL
jgi:hypothetical protein